MAGAILPDLLDKPIGRIFFEDHFNTSRLWGHTLLFVTVLLVVIRLALRGSTARTWLILPIAALIHLMLDGMWNNPVTLFWPFFGTTFPPHPVERYWLDVLLRPWQHPAEGLKELVGLGLLLYFGYAYQLHKRDRFRQFLKSGRLTEERSIRAT